MTVVRLVSQVVSSIERPTPPYVVRHIAGKLLGIRTGEPRTLAEWLSLAGSFRRVADEVPGPIVVCADLRRLQWMSEEVASALLVGCVQLNPRILRSALMLPGNVPTLRLQLERLLRQAGNPARRLCLDSAEVKAWLTSSLSAAEQRGLAEFLAVPVP